MLSSTKFMLKNCEMETQAYENFRDEIPLQTCNTLSKFMILCWTVFIATLGHMQDPEAVGLRLDTLDREDFIREHKLTPCWNFHFSLLDKGRKTTEKSIIHNISLLSYIVFQSDEFLGVIYFI